VQNSCGSRKLSSFSNTNVKYTSIQGENTTCASPWYQSSNLTGFILGSDNLSYAACSFYRFFTSPNATTLKVSNTLHYLVGFKVFPNVNATTIVASGDSESLEWLISDKATSLALAGLTVMTAMAGLMV
jgi:hypothetical protein